MNRFYSHACFFVILGWWPALHLAGQAPLPALGKKAANRQPSLVELGKLYQALDLPLPPKGAFFAVTGDFNVPLSYALSNEEFHYQIHFATGGPYPQIPYRVWQGFRGYPARRLEFVFARPPMPEVLLRFLKLDALHGPGRCEGDGYGDLIFAVQCQLLQHFDLAKFFFSRSEKRLKEPSDRSLVLLAWNYWAEEIADAKRDRAEVAQKLRKLVEKHAFFEILSAKAASDEDGREKHGRHQELLDRLDLTAKPVRTVPGSIEAMIEELLEDPLAQDPINMGSGAGGTEDDEYLLPNNGKLPPRYVLLDPYRKLRNLGFAAIPQLIEHVNDSRLVREPLSTSALVGRRHSGVLTLDSRDFPSVGERVRYILSAFFDLDQEKATKDEYVKSWNELKLMTEDNFVTKRLKNLEGVNNDFIRFVCGKYHERALKLYEEVLSKSIDFRFFGNLVESLAASDLPKATKVELLARGARSSHDYQSYEALKELLRLDNPAFSSASIASLEKLAWDGKGEYGDRVRVDIVSLAFRTEDRKTREAAEKYVKGLPPNQKLAVLKQLRFDSAFGPVRLETLSFLCQFLDDSSAYQDPKEKEQGFRNLRFRPDEMEVRNFAALQLLQNIGVDKMITKETSEDEWQKLREFAKDEVDRRLKYQSKQ